MVECGVCGGKIFAPFFRGREWSISGRYLATPVNPGAPVTIGLEYCQSCSLIRQIPGGIAHLDYGEIVRGTAKQLPSYADRIIASLSEFGVKDDDLILEIGANDGTFLKRLHDCGFSNLLGVEPSKQLAEISAQAGFDIVAGYFGRDLAAQISSSHGPVRAVICRHTLEHVPDISEFAAGVADVLGAGGMSFIEVPDTDWVVTRLFAHEIWDEHITYFRAGSLAKLVTRAGLTPIRLERVRFRDTRNLLCWSTRQPEVLSSSASVADDEATIDDLATFQKRWDDFSGRLRTLVAKAPKPIIGIGAAHIQLNFLNFSGLDDAVDFLVDDDPTKTGRFAPLAKPTPIRNTAEIIASLREGTLLRTAFPYPDWERSISEALQIHGIGSIEPYASRAADEL
jgi:hypothetical protein